MPERPKSDAVSGALAALIDDRVQLVARRVAVDRWRSEKKPEENRDREHFEPAEAVLVVEGK